MLEQGDFAKCAFLLYSIPQGEVDLTAFHAVTDSKEYSPLEELKLKRVSPLKYWDPCEVSNRFV
jgi:hypothetical protein